MEIKLEYIILVIILGFLLFPFLKMNQQYSCNNVKEVFLSFLERAFNNYTELSYKIDCKGSYALVNFSLYLPQRSLEVYGNVYIMKDKIFYSYYDVNENRVIRLIKFEEKYRIPKRKINEIILGVMSFCPFGNEAENRLLPLISKYLNKTKFQIVYIISKTCNNKTLECYRSLHGPEELLEDIREYCVYQLYGFEKWKNFVLKINKECTLENLKDCWKRVAKEANLDVNAIEKCIKEKGVEIAEKMYNLTEKYKIYASPTLIVNGVRIEGLRDYTKILEDLWK